MRRRSRARLGTVLTLVISLAALMPAGASAASHYVDMDNGYSFHPGTKTIARGDRVIFRNKSSTTPHDVKSNLSGYFVSPGGAGGMEGDTSTATYPKTFKQAGSFAFFCREHENEGMDGTIVVPIKVTRSGNTFTITAASASMSGTKWRNRIQVRKPGSSTWQTITATSAKSVSWGSSQHGTFRFRSAVKNSQTGALSGYSPTVSKTK
jgi:plastocyanin